MVALNASTALPVDTSVERVVCALRVALAPGILGAPTHRLAVSPDGRWVAVCLWWDTAGLAFVVEASARDAVVEEALATVDRSG